MFLKIQMLKGFPDRLLVGPSALTPGSALYAWIEFKTTRGVLSRLQEIRITELQSLGCLVYTVRSVEQFKDTFNFK
jgi:hypothetical protein